MTTIGSCHLIVNNKLAMTVSVTSQRLAFFVGEVFLHYFFKWTPSTSANIFSHYFAHFGKTLNISTANNSNLTVLAEAPRRITLVQKKFLTY